jgi:hypothetical protein
LHVADEGVVLDEKVLSLKEKVLSLKVHGGLTLDDVGVGLSPPVDVIGYL